MSEAFLSMLESLKEFNQVMREVDKQDEMSLPTGPIDPENLNIMAVKVYRSRKYEAVAFYISGETRKLIKLDEVYDTKKDALAATKRIAKEVKSGMRIIEFPEVK